MPLEATIKLLILVLDLAGTFVFALSGASAAVRARLDIFGVLVVAFAAASSGGIARDVLLGATPPAAIADWRYMAVSMLAGLTTFYFMPAIQRWRGSVTIFDAVGLALFAVAGAQKALALGANPFTATLLGMMTGIGGGIARDMLLAQVPAVLRPTEIYALAALAGAALVILGAQLDLPSAPTALVAAGACFAIRLVAIRRGWRLPMAGAVADE